MQRGSPSLKRRRSWLEIGIAGCSLLASPAEAAWPSFGSLWRSFTSVQDPLYHRRAEVLQGRQHGNHHGTPPAAAPAASLRASAHSSTPEPSRQRRQRRGQQPLDRVGSTPALLALAELDTQPASPRGRELEVEIALQGRHGDWEACSPDTCTQTRLVFCETLKSRTIVANDLCGDELPDAEQPCAGEDVPSVCDDGGADAAAPDGDGGDGRQAGGGSAYKAAAAPTRSVDAGGKAVGRRDSKEAAPSTPPSAADSRVRNSPPAAAGSRSGPGHTGLEVAAPSTQRGAGRETPSKASKTGGTVVGATTEEERREPRGKGDTGEGPETNGNAVVAAGKSTGSAAAEPREDGGSGEEAGWEAHQLDKYSGNSPAKQNGVGSNAATDTPSHEEPAGPPVLARIGGSASKSGRAEYRFWMVLAIGAGAVGSFMAVVVFAVGQYRKEQHRLRGIMALNEFPQDNYINPFARQASADLQLSDDDRSAFKL